MNPRIKKAEESRPLDPNEKRRGFVLQADPWEPNPVSLLEAQAIQALVQGKATAQQQELVVGWIEQATAIGELEFRSDSERASAFAAGKRFVGLQFFMLAKAVFQP